MGPVGVVVVDVDVQDALELPAAGDEEPVEAVAADGADPAFGERVGLGRPKWGADDLDALASEDRVERAAELAVAVVDQDKRTPKQQVQQRHDQQDPPSTRIRRGRLYGCDSAPSGFPTTGWIYAPDTL